MWSKGAVIVKIHGDKSMGNQMVQGCNLKLVPVQEYERMERENFFLKRQNSKDIQSKIIDAQNKYGYNRKMGKIEGNILVGIACIVLALDALHDKNTKSKRRVRR